MNAERKAAGRTHPINRNEQKNLEKQNICTLMQTFYECRKNRKECYEDEEEKSTKR